MTDFSALRVLNVARKPLDIPTACSKDLTAQLNGCAHLQLGMFNYTRRMMILLWSRAFSDLGPGTLVTRIHLRWPCNRRNTREIHSVSFFKTRDWASKCKILDTVA